MNKGEDGGDTSCLHTYSRSCTVCGISAVVTGLIYGIIFLLTRYYLMPDSFQFFETVPTYVPAITYLVCGLLTLAFAFKRYRNFFLLKISSYLALANSILSCVISLAVVFINLKILHAVNMETCAQVEGTQTCGCTTEKFSPAFPEDKQIVFDHGGDCSSSVSVLTFCLVLMVPTSIASAFLSIYIWRLLDELIDY